MKAFRKAEHDKKCFQPALVDVPGKVVDAVAAVVAGGVVEDVADVVLGDLCVDAVVPIAEHEHGGALGDFLTYLASLPSFPQVDTDSFELLEAAAVRDRRAAIVLCSQPDFFGVDDFIAFSASSSSSPYFLHSFDLSKAPFSYPEAIVQLYTSLLDIISLVRNSWSQTVSCNTYKPFFLSDFIIITCLIYRFYDHFTFLDMWLDFSLSLSILYPKTSALRLMHKIVGLK